MTKHFIHKKCFGMSFGHDIHLHNVHQKVYQTSSTNNRHVMHLFFILQLMFIEFKVEHPQGVKCLQITNKHIYVFVTVLNVKKHIATSIILKKEGYIISFSLLNRANITLWVKDLQYSAYTNMARYTISQWLDMILYHKLCYPYGLPMPSTSIKTYQNVI